LILLDTNYFIRFLVAPATPELRRMAEAAQSLLSAAERGEVEITTTEVVLHEVAFVLASKRHYALPAGEIAGKMAAILRLPAFRLPRGEKRRYLDALDLWSRHPALGFADALVATTAISREAESATFDRHFNRFAGLKRWQPPESTRAE
jgi:predicted nucleic acid-binding protein